MRTLKELYELLLIQFIDGNHSCICAAKIHLQCIRKISNEEFVKLEKDFYSRKPKWYNSRFWWKKDYNKWSDKYDYWWKFKSPSRIKFLVSIIDSL